MPRLKEGGLIYRIEAGRYTVSKSRPPISIEAPTAEAATIVTIAAEVI